MTFDGATILILEDEPIIGLALEDMLSLQGASVLHASRIEEACDLIAEEQVDSAVLDVNVHGTLSYAVAQLLAEREIPFIFATGYGDRSHPVEFADVPTVSKPYSADDIRTALLTRAN
jgi:response regulator RpfG family c-di-GMP phosphodiesterase